MLKVFLMILLVFFETHLYAREHVVGTIHVMPSDSVVQIDFPLTNPKASLTRSFALVQSRHLIFDFSNTVEPKTKRFHRISCKKIDAKPLQKYCILETPGRTRVILSLSTLVPYQAHLEENVYRIILNKTPHTGGKAPVEIQHIRFFSRGNREIRIEVNVSEKACPVEIKRNGDKLFLNFHESRLSSLVKKRYNLRDFQSPVERVLASQAEKNSVVTIIHKKQEDFGYFVYQADKKIIVDVYPLAEKGIKDQNAHKKTYTGKLISLNFQNVPIRAVLQILADFTGINMIVSDKVSANITLRLHNTPWDQALDIILENNALERRFTGNVMRIVPKKKKQRQISRKSSLEHLSLQIKYAKAIDIAHFLKDEDSSLLSKRGMVSVDERTNTLWIQDSRKHLNLIESVVKERDVPAGQVLIEARIVDVNKDFVRDLGLSWGLSGISLNKARAHGLNDLPLVEAGDTTFADKLHVDVVKAPLPVRAASVGLALATLGDDVLLDLELSAMESEGRGEIIASPRLITMNQQTALIQSGEEVPYQESTRSGATSVSFKKAVLSLQVTPRITSDGKIMMDLQINQDRLSTQKYNGVPAIMTKEIKTSVFVKNGQTIVLGGIYKQEKGSSVERVPFLGKLPGLGVLFRRENRTNSNEELLIFITPKIIADG